MSRGRRRNMKEKCKYNYDGKCNLKYCDCIAVCDDFEENKYQTKGKEEYA
jgi:hypothetical protein